MTVGELIQELHAYPMDAPVYAYEGEFCGLVILDPDVNERRELGHVECAEETR